MTRALVTGLGAITPIGLTAHDFWTNLVGGVSGVTLTTRFDTSDLPVKISAEVKGFDVGKYMDPRGARRMSRFAQFAVAAAQLAADDAGLVLQDSERSRAASAIATGSGGAIDTMEESIMLRDRGANRVSPFYIPMMAPNMGACQVSMHLGLRGPAMASVAACASGLYSYIEAKQLIDSGRADVRARGRHRGSASPIAYRRAREHEGGGKLAGDVDPRRRRSRRRDSPVPGGVGPMTIAMLLENTLEAAAATGPRAS